MAKKDKHLDTCRDDQCTSCVVGELELEISASDGGVLSPHDLYTMAQEEMVVPTLSAEIDLKTHSRIVSQLLERATAEFDRLKIVDDSSISCLYDLGVYSKASEPLLRAEKALNKIATKTEEHLLLLARIYLKLSIDETIPQDVHYLDQAIVTFDKALGLSESQRNQSLLIASSSLLEYGLTIREAATLSVVKTLTASLKYLNQSHESSLISRSRGTCYFHLASIESNQPTNLKSALINTKLAIASFLKAIDEVPSVADLQLLAQSYLLQSSLDLDDDDAAIEAFDAAESALKSALELDPENKSIQQQLHDIDTL